MTNKPMLSVERGLIQRIADHCKFWVDHPYLEAIADVEIELRALLDEPDEPFNLQGWSIDHSAGRRGGKGREQLI